MTNRTIRRSISTILAAGVLLLGACHSDDNDNQIKPIQASVSTPNAVPSGPAVYLRVASSDSPVDDVVPLEVVLTTGAAPVSLDAFNIEIRPVDPANPGQLRDGIVQFVFDTAAGTTAIGACNSCVKGLASGGCTGFPACTPCGSCPQGPPADPATNPASTPACFAATSSTRSFLASAATIGNSGCAPKVVAANTEIPLAVINVFARTTGTARLAFQINPNVNGDCEVLLATAVVPVTFDDRGAVFSAGR